MHGHHPALLLEQNAVEPLLQVQRLGSGLWGAPRPEEALRVLKWPLIPSQPPVLAAPPYPPSSIPPGSGAQTSRD